MSPENPTFAVLSQGCAANFGDGERIARALAAQHEGCRILFSLPEVKAEDAAAPDAIYLNICTVKGNTGALKLLRKVLDMYPEVPVRITGCAPKDFREEALKIAPQVIFTSLADINGKTLAHPAMDDKAITLRESPFVGIVNIEEGCLDACAFCSTHLVKGRLHSENPALVVEQVQRLVNDGCREIQLTGQDCACYGFDIGTDLARLTQQILVHVPGDYRIRLGMGNPRHMLQYADELFECFQDERLYKFIHIPVQSGSDSVLKAMNRRHTADDFHRIADAFNTRFPLATLSTDLIVGFPGETDSDFEATLRLLRDSRPTVCNITRFVARPGTAAARMEADAALRVPDNVKHERSAVLAAAFQKIAQQNNAAWIGRECRVTAEKAGHRSGTSIARNEAYRPVALVGDIPAGKSLQVRITGAEPFALIGEPL